VVRRAPRCGAPRSRRAAGGSRGRLEFDHIIPVSRGGANTVRNIELRCEPCNRRKGARV
jgi:5-methylcytosine-specific restriction endonuclease McrA